MKSQWAAALQEALESKVDAVPEGWLTTKQIEAAEGIGAKAAERMISRLREAGRVETAQFRVVLPGGMIRTTPHYRLK